MSSPFDAYSRFYDLLYADKDYAGEAAYLAGHLRRRAPQAKRILELGCGTGAHAAALARLGYQVHGIDLSDSMLSKAQARRAALPADLASRLSFAAGDARSARVPAVEGGEGAGFDAVISLFHVMSYQATNADLQAVYATAAAHLRLGGVFLFDYWNGPAVLAQAPSVRVRRLADAKVRVTRIAEPVMHWQRNVCDVDYTLFVEAVATGAVHQFSERHPMRYLFQPELALLEAGAWRDAEDFAWLGTQPPDERAWAALRVLSLA